MLFILQIEDAAVEYFKGVIWQDNIIVNYKVPEQLEYLAEYVEGW